MNRTTEMINEIYATREDRGNDLGLVIDTIEILERLEQYEVDLLDDTMFNSNKAKRVSTDMYNSLVSEDFDYTILEVEYLICYVKLETHGKTVYYKVEGEEDIHETFFNSGNIGVVEVRGNYYEYEVEFFSGITVELGKGEDIYFVRSKATTKEELVKGIEEYLDSKN